MFSILGYEFFQNALIAGLLASVVCGIIGSYVVVKHMVSISGGISHASFGGIGLGYYLGIDPIVGAFWFTLAVAVGMGGLMIKAKQEIDTLIGAVWSGGMAVGILFVSLTPGFAPDLFSYLFGNILLVPDGILITMGILVLIVVAVVVLLYNELMAVTFDEEFAQVSGLPVSWLNLLLLVLIAVAVVLLIRVVGIILVIALLTIPAAIAREYTGNLKMMMLFAVLLGMLFTTVGIWFSYVWDIPSGATIILVSVSVYILSVTLGRFPEICRKLTKYP